MKKLTLLTLLLITALMVPLGAGALEAVANPDEVPSILTAKEAIDLARLKLTSQNVDMDTPFSEVKTTLLKGDDGALYWYASFFLPIEMSDQLSWAKIDAQKGTVMASGFNDPYEIHTLWEEEMGQSALWSFETKALFDQIFRSTLARPLNVVPTGQEAISQTQAADIAKTTLKNTLTITDEEADQLHTSWDFLWGSNIAADANPDERVWVVYFHQGSSADQASNVLYQVNISADNGSVYLLSDNQNTDG